ncbi:RusA family crossover junction endodeoxyribonuclease [Crocosphaera sp. XPORK-15E]|uniref:RusA family crossover junction endodeoxyribonuclease n=1 Tax=Crocosphaera sp. XPORK-15E TaxID=3110247 RepID=UPI002B21A3AA|nr:RusA family crossover junction endodeoxyribonuclease [Crocosphaera sp. XPORK-15E]MEA5533736.1 RusA family crossover junction endodeoxyribonuclease [Crocosphaera sp. XPORK-15E]
MIFDFLIPQRPRSVQAKNVQTWKHTVKTEAQKTWTGTVLPEDLELHLTLVYLYHRDPVDVDNIIKPIQDALIGVIYEDDQQITDVQAHRRHLKGTFDPLNYPDLLLQGIYTGSECVYVRICQSKTLESYL